MGYGRAGDTGEGGWQGMGVGHTDANKLVYDILPLLIELLQG